MPLPRFHRLSAQRRAEILGVAREHFARDGHATASYNKIVAAAGISKTSAYQYFDGREDLLETVLTDVLDRLAAALGPWTPATTAAHFWPGLRTGMLRLLEHLAHHPDDAALVGAAAERAAPGFDRWLTAVLDNGLAIGVIRRDIDPALLSAATGAVFHAADAWLLDARRAGHAAPGAAEAVDQVLQLLAGLWRPTDSPV
ncbi:TetR/AcrR family transcriptional regulator [Nocardia sp. CDC159]|uniref:TetR/AcrR family transcriptional regulator n=1 Tax=Nocardia pulmonis TaxID=2951408 RepID=A0A9X2IW94_9NOCA|nr:MULTISPECIES: TetR/AcrR family transcriptional regulator [Nocardia]MCM6774053.1 TetR/AcrR family transcriptional regulator [Nocardia pulmonis]MCM6786940.1 TetR/AcrR family transcriptional regulator [Nocardia sp. CDC159]